MLKESKGHPLMSISPLGTMGLDGQERLKESIGFYLLSFSPFNRAIIRESIGHPLMSVNPLGTKGLDGEKGRKESIGHHLLSISLLKKKGRDRQAELKGMLKESMGHHLLSINPLKKGKGWTSRMKGSVKGLHRTSCNVQ